MSKVNFTAKRVLELECEPGKSQSIHRDAAQPGLGLRVTAAGERAYIHEQKLNSRTIRITIGSPAAWPLEKARTESARLRVLIDSGKDPREERRQQDAAAEARMTEAERASVTLREAWDTYLAARKLKWSERHYSDHVRLAQAGGEEKKRGAGLTTAGPLAALMPLKLTDLTPKLIEQWLMGEASRRPEVVRMAFARLSIFAAWCETRTEFTGLLSQKAVETKLAKAVLPKQKAKQDVLQREQLAPWFAAVRKIESPVVSAYLQILLLTGARREELAGLRWGNVDFKWGSLTIGDKVEGTRVIPLTGYVKALLLTLKRLNDAPPNVRQLREQFANNIENWSPSEYVFSSSASSTGRLTSPTRAMNRACAVAGVPHVTLHGLRRSFSTLSEWVDLPTGVVAQVMGHKPSAVAERHYKVRPLDMLREHAQKFEAWLLKESGIEFQPAADEQKTSLKLAV